MSGWNEVSLGVLPHNWAKHNKADIRPAVHQGQKGARASPNSAYGLERGARLLDLLHQSPLS